MLPNSLNCFLFFCVFLFAYWLLPRRGQNLLLLAGSYIFYSFWDYRFLGLILVSTTVDFLVGRALEAEEQDARRKRLLVVSLVVNLGLLCIFKYFNFFVDGAERLLALAGFSPHHWHLNVVLPVGISFYTFKTLSYVLDVHGRQMKPVTRWVDYAAFVAFFPQLLAGPIDRASALLPQIERDRRIDVSGVYASFWLISWGLFKKVVVADNLIELIAPAFASPDSVSTSQAWVSLYAYAIQLYCDFSGYTDMARGMAGLLGFETAINFRNPYFATNPVDFWQRWHISLSSWIQDYVYFPLAAAFLRRGTSPIHQYGPHVMTMLLIGLWHGASMTYVAFGFYWGVVIVAYNVLRKLLKKRAKRVAGSSVMAAASGRFSWRRIAVTFAFFHVVCAAFVLFRAPTLDAAFRYYATLLDWSDGVWLFGGWGQVSLNSLAVAVFLYFTVLAVQLLQEARGDLLAPLKLSLVPRSLLYAGIAVMLLLFGNTGGGAFIYMDF